MSCSLPCALAALALLALCAGEAGAAGPLPFAGVSQARVAFSGGVPRLTLNGRPTLPLVFFFNTDPGNAKNRQYLAEQVRLAAGAGVHLYSLPLRCPRLPDGVTPNYAWSDGLLDAFIQADPQATFILRLYPGPQRSWREWAQIPESEFAHFADGSRGQVSLASDWFWGPTDQDLAALIRRYEASPYGPRLLGYHPGGPDSEMFHDSYREKGPDYSPANQRRFRLWLSRRYPDDLALQQAWANPQVTLATAGIPTFPPGRFPMHGVSGEETVRFFYDLPAERDWVDFSAYANELVAERIETWAELIKRETGGRKLVVFFYGYTFELPGSFSGHYCLQRVLACPQVDVLVSPYSYHERGPGGPGSFMSPVDSVTAHGKLWLNEDDTRTSLLDLSQIPGQWLLFDQPAASLPATLGLLERNFAAILTHRAGTWWMDLMAAGAFNHPALWDMLQARAGLYAELYRHPTPYRPQVALIVDERSKLYVKSDWDANYLTLVRLRDEAARSGAAVGYYTLDDFTAGLVPRCPVYLFPNSFCLDAGQVRRLRSRLDREQATAIWLYAPGYLSPAGPDLAQASRLAGLQLAVQDGLQGSRGEGLLARLAWGAGVRVSPRLVVSDERAVPLGRYRADGLVSAAMVQAGRHRSVFLGDMEVSRQVLARLFASAGAHLWTRGGEVVHTDGSILAVHSGRAGLVRIYLPPGTRAEPLQARLARRQASLLLARFEAGETCWFRLQAPVSR